MPSILSGRRRPQASVIYPNWPKECYRVQVENLCNLANDDIPEFPKIKIVKRGNIGWYGKNTGNGINNFGHLQTDLGVSDTSAPFGPDNVWYTKYRNGLPGGVGPCWWEAWGDPTGAPNTNQAKKIYYVHIYKIQGGAHLTGTDWQQNATGHKWGFISYGGNPSTGTNEGIPFITNDGTSVDLKIITQMKCRWGHQGNGMSSLFWSQNNTFGSVWTVQVGRWYRDEWILTLNSDVTSTVDTEGNGSLKLYHTDITTNGIDSTGDLIMTIDRNIAFRNPPTYPNGFQYFKYNPTFGGGGPDKTRDDWVYHARWMIATEDI